LEEGASGFLQKKISPETLELGKKETEGDWDVFNKIISDESGIDASFGSKTWASVYLASTPQQAALMGLEFPGVNEVAIYFRLFYCFNILYWIGCICLRNQR
jgi:hypothetical protein